MTLQSGAQGPCSSAIPPRAGVGLKAEHYKTILDADPDIGFFEVHAENYMGAGGPPHRYLAAIRERYRLSLHGVGLSIGADRPLDREHLTRLKQLVERYEPALTDVVLRATSRDVRGRVTFLLDGRHAETGNVARLRLVFDTWTRRLEVVEEAA